MTASSAPESAPLAGSGLAGRDLAGPDLAGPDLAGPDTVPLTALAEILPARPGPVLAAPGDSIAGHDRPGHSQRGHRPQRRRPPGRSRLRRSRARSAPAATPAPGQLPAQQRGIGRGLVTPWFAAATGFFIAASLLIYSPQGRLTYPIAVGKVPRCSPRGCGPDVEGQGSRQLTITSGQQLQPRHKSASIAAQAGTRRRARTAASGLSFGYVVHPAWRGQFEVLISVTGKRDFTHWTLAFALPGDHIKFVRGARWRAESSDSGFARPFSGDPSQWRGGPRGGNGSGGQGASQGGHANGQGGGPGQPGVSFTVIASGKPRHPAHCSYDGAACKFHRLKSG